MSTRRPTRIGRYEVLDRLGVGGMGAVYLASDPLLGRTVAVKVLRTDDDELRERFAREARSAASLKHHHIVTIYDIGEDDEGRPFLAMEYIDGESMAEMIRRRAPIALHQRLKYIIDLCAGLGYAHRTGIVHRDIKPANLMVTSEGVLKIVDFGLARITSAAGGLTRAGTLLGTVHYMSPEQTDGTVVDHLSDIFSVGLVLYEILAYRKAYPGDSAPVVLHNIVHTDPEPIGRFLAERDEELEWIVGRAIEKQRPRRYQDLRELAAALETVRSRFEATDPDATIVSRPATDPASQRTTNAGEISAPTEVSPNAMPASPRPRTTDPRHLRNLDVIAQRRAAQIAQRLAAAVEHFAAGRYEAAVEQCESAILINPDETRALQLLEQAHQALNDRQINQWVTEARSQLSRGELTQAEELIEQALQLRADSPEAIAVRNQVRQTRRERERAADRARAVAAAVERARRNLQAGALEAAVRAATEALAYDPDQQEARELRDQAAAGLEARRRQQEHDQAAVTVTAKARELADAGKHSDALDLLRGFSPPHVVVDEAISEIEGRVAALERQRREEIERARLRAIEETRRREQLTALRAVTTTALERGDFTAARGALEQARRQPLVPGDSELEHVCLEIDAAIEAAEAAARLRATIDRHLQSVQAAIATGDLVAAAKSVDAALSLAPEDPEAHRLQRQVRELKKAAAAAEIAAQRRAAMERQFTAAQNALANGDLAAAARLVEATLRFAPDEPDVLSLQQQIRQAQEAKARDEQQRRAAGDAARRARELFAAGRAPEAFRVLADFEPHALVAVVERELRDRQAQLEREAREREELDRQVREREERERESREREAHERQEREAREKAESERQEQERRAREREKRERQERERQEREAREKAERERQERERREREALEQAERERQEREIQQRDREERERKERERQEREAREKVERERQEQERQEREREDRERRERERQEREREKRERKERERQAREAAARAEQQERERRQHARREVSVPPAPSPVAKAHPAPPHTDNRGETEQAAAVAGAADAVDRDTARTRLVVGIGAVAIVLLAVGGAWWALDDRTSGEPPEAPAPTVSYAKELAAAREQLRSGDLAAAARVARAIPPTAPEAGDTSNLLREIRSEAQTRAQNARASAERSGEADQASFREAAAKDAEAARLTRPEDLEAVIALYDEAASLYRKAATTGASVAELVQLARAEAKANRVRTAVAYALQVLEANPGHGETLALLRTTREQAQKLAQTAAAEARRAGVSSDNSPAFKEAAAQESAAARLSTPQDTLRAYEGFQSAANRYREAAEQFKTDTTRRLAEARSARDQAEQRLQSGDLDGAEAALAQAERFEPTAAAIPALRKRLADARARRTTPAPPAELDQALNAAIKTTDDTQALKLLSDLASRYPNDPRVDAALRARRQARDARVADLLKRAQAAADAQALDLLEEAVRLDPSRQDIQSERDRRRSALASGRAVQDLRNLMLQLEAAYEDGNVAEIIRIAPVMDRGRLDAQFKSFRIRWDVEPCTVRVEPSGTAANMTCVIQETAQPTGIRAPAQTTRQTRQFAVSLVDGAWRITAQRIQ